MSKKICLLFILLSIASCKNENEKDQIKSAHWLLGKWESKTDEGSLTENWTKLNDSTFQGTSFFIKDKDTLHFEHMLLQQKGEALLYKATVIGQNNDKAVGFILSSKTPKSLVFENPKHDYPQKISYKQIDKDNFVATISGIQLGKPSSESFKMKKQQTEK